jgi:uncharacterized membrane protein YjgN (DUF898 family)
MPAAPAAPAAPEAAAVPLVPVMFEGSRREFFRLVARGALLQLITFGFYRFWLSTHIRRHLWSGTSVEGDAAEYTGTPIELLIGFLFAIAILIPVYILYFAIGVWAEVYQAFASLPLILFFYLFIQFALYRARRYRMSRTIWRGVRFWMRGSGWDYAWRAVLSTVPVALTFGLLLPWRTAVLERFKMKNSYYGNLQGSFDGTAGALFGAGWPFWLASVALLLVGGYFFPPAVWLGVPFIYACYRAIEWRWWISGMRFGEVRFASDLPTGELIDLYWKVIGWGVLIVITAVILFTFVFAAVLLANGVELNFKAFGPALNARPVLAIVVGIIGAVFYLAVILSMGVVTQLYLTRDMWQRVASSAFVTNLSAADHVIAQGDAANAVGEGFADGFDVGGI